MRQLTIQLYYNEKSAWQDIAELKFYNKNNDEIEIEYDVDYAAQHLGLSDSRALSLSFPVNLHLYKGVMPGFLIDLIPQGEPLRKLLSRYNIQGQENYFEILGKIPLASPGNIRIKEPWADIETRKKN